MSNVICPCHRVIHRNESAFWVVNHIHLYVLGLVSISLKDNVAANIHRGIRDHVLDAVSVGSMLYTASNERLMLAYEKVAV